MMKFSYLIIASIFVAGTLTACEDAEEPVSAPSVYEGDHPGECSDKADNDRNGYFDCQDKSCWGSPDCAQNNQTHSMLDAGHSAQDAAAAFPDAQVVATDAGMTANPKLAALKGVELVYMQRIDVQGNFESTYCMQYMLCDCVNRYVGNGVAVEQEDSRVTFEGTWKLEQSDCGPDFQQLTWVDSTEKAFHSFVFSSDTQNLDAWLAHGVRSASSPLPSPKMNKQWYITQMNAAYDEVTRTAAHSEVQLDASDPLAPVELTHTVTVSFNLQ